MEPVISVVLIESFYLFVLGVHKEREQIHTLTLPVFFFQWVCVCVCVQQSE